MTMENSLPAKEEYIRDNRSYIGMEICKFRLKKGFSQAVLAEHMGISRATISKIENGKFAISVDYLAKFAWHLHFDLRLLEKNHHDR